MQNSFLDVILASDMNLDMNATYQKMNIVTHQDSESDIETATSTAKATPARALQSALTVTVNQKIEDINSRSKSKCSRSDHITRVHTAKRYHDCRRQRPHKRNIANHQTIPIQLRMTCPWFSSQACLDLRTSPGMIAECRSKCATRTCPDEPDTPDYPDPQPISTSLLIPLSDPPQRKLCSIKDTPKAALATPQDHYSNQYIGWLKGINHQAKLLNVDEISLFTMKLTKNIPYLRPFLNTELQETPQTLQAPVLYLRPKADQPTSQIHMKVQQINIIPASQHPPHTVSLFSKNI